MSNSSKIVVAVFAGLAAGTALGVLIAPNEGRENRQLLCRSIKGLRLSITKTAADELYRFSNWKRQMIISIKALLFSPEPEAPDDLEHG